MAASSRAFWRSLLSCMLTPDVRLAQRFPLRNVCISVPPGTHFPSDGDRDDECPRTARADRVHGVGVKAGRSRMVPLARARPGAPHRCDVTYTVTSAGVEADQESARMSTRFLSGHAGVTVVRLRLCEAQAPRRGAARINRGEGPKERA
ncbi:hypothetical protein GCM10023196_086080 [Actinoallomurus vinaceus]|uniref:Secreted protein n=1 Tax=Actinoallomurus vinaceus TaxID=1080074 RepID=A0ABP8UNY6_9ACTN